MERLEAESERLTRRGILAKNKAEGVLYPPGQCGHKLTLPRPPRAPSNELKLAAVAVDLNVRPRSADMPPTMQERAFRYTRALLDAYPEKKPSPTQLAMCLKKVCTSVYKSGFSFFPIDDYFCCRNLMQLMEWHGTASLGRVSDHL